jgi:hypothetical protein
MRSQITVAAWPEVALPRAEAIDVGHGGCLLAFVEPIGLVIGRRVLISARGAAGVAHVMGSVVRCERGTDFRTYVAVEFVDLADEEYDVLLDAVAPTDEQAA